MYMHMRPCALLEELALTLTLTLVPRAVHLLEELAQLVRVLNRCVQCLGHHR